jgi:hypothetical protein
MEPGVVARPALDDGGLVGAVVVQDHMDLERLGYVPMDSAQELEEFRGAVPAMALSDDRTFSTNSGSLTFHTMAVLRNIGRSKGTSITRINDSGHEVGAGKWVDSPPDR